MPRLLRHLSFFFCCAVLLLMLVSGTGCTTSRQTLFTTSGDGWQIQQGQAIWRPREGFPEIAGELVFARHPDGRYLIEFSKSPIVMCMAQTTPKRWLIRFPPQDLGFGGRGRPSPRFLWLHLPSALEGKELPGSITLERDADGGWRLVNARSGEFVKGFLEQ